MKSLPSLKMPLKKEILIECKEIRRVYQTGDVKTVALNGIDFSVKKGEFVAIMGPSGSGKSTLLHILGMLDHPSDGQYLFEGKDVTSLEDHELAAIRNFEIGFVFQHFNLLKRTTVFDNVKLPLYYSTIPEKEWKKIVEHAIDSVGLTHRIHHVSSQLSGGEQQRVAIARAIVNSPSLILADEPTGNLDSKSGGQIMDIIQGLNKQGRTVLLITHETYTSEYAKRIIRLSDGEIISDKKRRAKRNGTKQFRK